MKMLILSLIIGLGFTSCQTTNFNPGQTTSIVSSVLPSATRLAISKKPETKKYFLLLADTIDIFASNQDLTPQNLEAAVNAIGVKELRTSEAQAAITTVFALYKSFYGDIVSQKLDEKNLKTLLQAIAQSIRDGLNLDKNPINVIP